MAMCVVPRRAHTFARRRRWVGETMGTPSECSEWEDAALRLAAEDAAVERLTHEIELTRATIAGALMRADRVTEQPTTTHAHSGRRAWKMMVWQHGEPA